MGSKASINKATGDADCNANNVCDPVIHIGAAVKARLDEFNGAAEDGCTHKHWEQSEAAGSGEGEG